MLARRFTEFIQAQVEKTDPNRIFLNKIETKRILTAYGAPCPCTLQDVATPRELDFCSAPPRFVVKATDFSSKKGIYPLVHLANGQYLNLFSGMKTTESDMVQELTALIGKSRNRVIMEEFIVGENGADAIPFDYKFYTFDGVVRFVLQIDRNVSPVGVAFFDYRFVPIRDDRVRIGPKYGSPAVPRRSSNWQEMLQIATGVSGNLNRPFISVDMYTTGTEAYVGELTPAPGGPYYGALFCFSAEFDEELGAYWRKSCERRGWPIPEISAFPPCRRHQASIATARSWREDLAAWLRRVRR